jgi:thymidine kinase
VEEEASKYDVIGIDEGQFFADVVTFSEKMANLGKVVLVAALDGTFQRKPFGCILDLIPLVCHRLHLDVNFYFTGRECHQVVWRVYGLLQRRRIF